MRDSRIEKLANLLVNYSCNLQKGEKILIEAIGIDSPLVCAIVDEVYKVGGFPFVEMVDKRVQRSILMGASEESIKLLAKHAASKMADMDAYIGIRGGNNCYELSDIPSETTQLYDKFYFFPVHDRIRVAKTKWVVLRYPTEGMSEQARMSTDAFEDFYFNVCTLDYKKMDKAMDSLQALLNRTDKVHIIAKDTDLSFSIKGIGSKKCSGHCNIPDGEVYSAPVKDSVNGYIHYNAPSIENGIEFKDVRLTFKDGKIIEATSSNTEASNAIFDTDEGSRYVGEFAIGVNPFITEPMGDILFDEKICGSIHFTPGCSYDDVPNGNKSAVHWDLVQIHRPEYGGGEIYFDDVLIRKDGIFTIPELFPLNPENLK